MNINISRGPLAETPAAEPILFQNRLFGLVTGGMSEKIERGGAGLISALDFSLPISIPGDTNFGFSLGEMANDVSAALRISGFNPSDATSSVNFLRPLTMSVR